MASLKQINERYGAEIDSPSIESMVVHTVMDADIDWSIDTHQSIHEAYFLQRGWKNGLTLPRSLEAGISLALAERYRASNEVQKAREHIKEGRGKLSRTQGTSNAGGAILLLNDN